MRVVAVYSTKGGVGKTTAAVNLAWEASQDFHVLLWDLDPQGAATFLLQVKPKMKGGVEALIDGKTRVQHAIRSTNIEHLDVLPADASYRDLDIIFDHSKHATGRVRQVLESVANEYDIVILDCPPGAALVAENAVLAADLIVVPLVPSPLSLRSLEQVTDLVQASTARPRILAFLSMVDRRKAVHRDARVTLPRTHKSVSDIVVPSTVVIERMGSERVPVGVYAPRTEAAHAYRELWVRIQSVLKAKPRKRKH